MIKFAGFARMWLVVFALLVGCSMLTVPLRAASTSPIPQGDQEKINVLLAAANSFRDEAMDGPKSAFSKFVVSGQEHNCHGLARQLFLEESPDLLWRKFFKSTLLTASFHGLDQALVGYYHPWNDLFLLTEWIVVEGSPRIQQMKFIHGDVLRKQGEPPYSITPLWTRSKLPAYASVAVDAAKTLRAFEKTFPTRLQPKGKFAWQPKLGLDQDPARARANDAAVRGAFTGWILASQTFFDNPQFGKIRQTLARHLDALKGGNIKDLLAEARETMVETSEVLQRSDGIAFVQGAKLQTVAYSQKHCFVFLTNPTTSHVYLSFWFDGGLDQPHLRRIDLMDIQQTYRKWAELKTTPEKPKKR